jgi:hypothetical protein
MSPDRNAATRRERRTIEAEKVGGRGVTTENGKLVEGEDKTKNKMLTTEDTEDTARPLAATKVRMASDSGMLLV